MGAMTEWTDIVALVVEQYGLKGGVENNGHRPEQVAEIVA
jgi:hypothetical protein